MHSILPHSHSVNIKAVALWDWRREYILLSIPLCVLLTGYILWSTWATITEVLLLILFGSRTEQSNNVTHSKTAFVSVFCKIQLVNIVIQKIYQAWLVVQWSGCKMLDRCSNPYRSPLFEWLPRSGWSPLAPEKNLNLLLKALLKSVDIHQV